MTTVVIASVVSVLGFVGFYRSCRPSPDNPKRVLTLARGSGESLREARNSGDLNSMTGFGSIKSADRTSLIGISAVALRAARFVVVTAENRQSLQVFLAPWLVAAEVDPVELVTKMLVLGCSVGLIIPFVWLVAEITGAHVPLEFPLWLCMIGFAVGSLVPVLEVRRKALEVRSHTRTVTGIYLDLVVLCLAGGMGIDGALQSAASVIDHGSGRQIASALNLARAAGQTPWAGLAALGKRLKVDELTECAAAVGLAGTEGAKVKATLTTKAASIRSHDLAGVEKEANTVTERLFFPAVLLLIGFLIFLGYPALARISAGF